MEKRHKGIVTVFKALHDLEAAEAEIKQLKGKELAYILHLEEIADERNLKAENLEAEIERLTVELMKEGYMELSGRAEVERFRKLLDWGYNIVYDFSGEDENEAFLKDAQAALMDILRTSH